MKPKPHTVEILKITCLILVLVGLLFAISAWAGASEGEGSTATEVSAQQTAPDIEALGQGVEQAIEPTPDMGYQQRRAARDARRQAQHERVRLAQQNANQNRVVPAEADLPAAALTGITMSFKLDSRLSGPTYGGERWVSPPTYTGASAQDTVDAKVEGIDAKGRRVRISPKWTSADPEIVDVSPSQGSTVKIIVKRAGESTVDVTSHGVSKTLSVKAEYRGNALQVQLSQKP